MYFAGEAKVRLNRYSIEYLGYSDKEIIILNEQLPCKTPPAPVQLPLSNHHLTHHPPLPL